MSRITLYRTDGLKSLFPVFIRICKRLLRIAVEAIAALIGVAVICLGLVIWRAGSGPITIDTIAPELAALLSNPAVGVRAEIGHAELVWDREAQALRLVGKTIKLYDSNNAVLAELPKLSLGLNFLAPLRGQRAPFEVFSDDFSVHLVRVEDGSFHFGQLQLDRNVAEDSAPSLDIKDYLRTLLQIKTGWFGLGQIGAVRIERVTVLIADQVAHKNWRVRFPLIDLTRKRSSVVGRAWLEIDEAGQQKRHIFIDAEFPRKTQILQLRARFTDLNPAFWADKFPQLSIAAAGDIALNGGILARFDSAMALQSLQADIDAKKGRLVLPDLWPEPVSIAALSLRAEADIARHRVTIENLILDVDGIKMAASLKALPDIDFPQSGMLNVSGEASIKDWPIEKLGAIWPEKMAPNPRAWIAENMSVGTFRQVFAAMTFKANWHNPDDIRAFKLKGGIKLENATIKYLEGMPPVTGVNAEAEADQSTLNIKVKSGKADALTFGLSPIVIDGLDGTKQTIMINLTGKNKVTDILRFIDHEPLRYGKAVGLQPQQLSGMADLDIKLGFPLLKDFPLADMQIDAKAAVTDLATEKLVPGMAISDGRLNLAVSATHMSVEGTARYNGVAMATSYRQEFSSPPSSDASLQSQAKLSGIVSPAQWAALGLDLGSVIKKGDAPVTITYGKGVSAPGELAIAADFTQTELDLPMLGWAKTVAQPATGKLKLIFAPKAVKLADVIFKAPQLDIHGEGELDSKNMNPIDLSCRSCTVGNTRADIKIGFEKGALRAITVEGASLDYRSSQKAAGAKKEEGQPLQIRLRVEKLYQGNGQFFTQAKADLRRDAFGWNYIDFHALAEGKTPVAITLLPDGERAPLRLTVTTDDLGSLLRATDATDQVHEGKLLIMGNSTFKFPRRIEGEIRLRKYRVRKLPFLAVLLNAASFTGFADMLGGQGINFDRLEGKYVWEGDRLTLEDIRTSGGALGLNLDGIIDFAANQGDFRGTVVPFSFFNKIIGNIPIVGEILTGGSGLIAVTYHAEGDLEDLKFDVNPVSVLAPGILRRIFFQGK